MNWMNIKDKLPEVEKELLFIEKYYTGWNKEIIYQMHIGYFDDNKRYFIAQDEEDYYGDKEEIILENIICWSYYDAEQIAQASENEYYKDKQ